MRLLRRSSIPVLVLAVATVALAWFAGTLTGVVVHTVDGRELLVEWSPLARALPVVGALVAWTALVVVLWRRPRSRGRVWAPAVVAVVAVLGFGLTPLVATPFGGWTIGPAVTLSDGRQYGVGSRFWTIGVLRLHDSTWLRTEWELLGRAGTDSPRRYAVLIEPADRPTALPAETSEGVILVTRPRCHLAYDPATETVLTRDELAVISPFALLRSDEAGAESSLAVLEEAIAEERDDALEAGALGRPVVLPSEEVLLRELGSDNAWVREAARRLVEAGGDDELPRGGALDE